MPADLLSGVHQRTRHTGAVFGHAEERRAVHGNEGESHTDAHEDLRRSADTNVIIVTHDTANAAKTDVTFRLEDGRLVEK